MFKLKSCKMLTMSWCHYLLLYITAGICISVCSGVHITKLNVPSLVELGSKEVILDCEYSFGNENSKGLVVKWFFNNKSILVYQWIHDQTPQDLGPLKGQLDLGYKASQESLHSHRALKILNPTANMTGNYICVVSTFVDEDFKSNSMLVFTPGKNFQLHHEKKDSDSVKLVCFAEDVYPQPTITITAQSEVIKDIKTDVVLGSDGLFDIIGTVVVKDNDLNDPEEFVCQMMVSQANFVATKQIVYYPGSGSYSHLNENRALYILFTLICLMIGYKIQQ